MELHDYDDLLLGVQKKITSFYTQDSGRNNAGNEAIALSIVRYAIEKILQWTPEEAAKKFDKYMIHVMKLDKIITYIRYPVEIQGEEALYILSKLYPNTVRLSPRQIVEIQYRHVLDDHRQFPRDYFVGTEGFYRYCVCFRYLFYNYKRFRNMEEMYQYALSPEGRRFLSAHRLLSPAIQLDIDMVDVVYEITKSKPHAEAYYARFTLKRALEKAKGADRGSDENCGDLQGDDAAAPFVVDGK